MTFLLLRQLFTINQSKSTPELFGAFCNISCQPCDSVSYPVTHVGGYRRGVGTAFTRVCEFVFVHRALKKEMA